MNINKVKAYIGFAIKSKQIVYGVDIIKEKQVKVVFFNNSLSEASKKSCENSAIKNNCSFHEISDDEMLELVGSEKIKAFAILNKDLAIAIEKNM